MVSLPGTLWACVVVPGHAGVRGNKITDKFARGSSVQRFVGPEPFLGGFWAEYKKKDKMLDGKPAPGIVAWSLWYIETGLRIDFWP
jgi:hypothetical protein